MMTNVRTCIILVFEDANMNWPQCTCWPVYVVFVNAKSEVLFPRYAVANLLGLCLDFSHNFSHAGIKLILEVKYKCVRIKTKILKNRGRK